MLRVVCRVVYSENIDACPHGDKARAVVTSPSTIAQSIGVPCAAKTNYLLFLELRISDPVHKANTEETPRASCIAVLVLQCGTPLSTLNTTTSRVPRSRYLLHLMMFYSVPKRVLLQEGS
jgi:hypothetical protein